jgi:type II secretory pathway component PulL
LPFGSPTPQTDNRLTEFEKCMNIQSTDSGLCVERAHADRLALPQQPHAWRVLVSNQNPWDEAAKSQEAARQLGSDLARSGSGLPYTMPVDLATQYNIKQGYWNEQDKNKSGSGS